jgi:polyisoprenoid-binding protein YceI
MGSSTETSVHFVADTRASQFTVQVFSGGMLSAFGHSPTIAIRDFVAEAEVNPDNPEQASLKVVIQAGSLSVKDDMSDKDKREIERMMQQEILEVSSYPGEGQYSVTLNGELTMHGITRPQTIPARVTLSGDSMRAFGNFTLRQTDYDLTLATVAGGALRVKDELKFSFNILARKKV